MHVGDLIGTVPFELADDKNFAIANIEAPEGKGKEGEE